jgi:hypothetical protein
VPLGFVPQGNVPGLYVYERKKRPSVVITILLLLLWIIPGIIYLIIGGERTVVSIKVTELPLNIEVEGDRGYGPGGSITVTCCNPSCGKPFEVDWDNVIVQLVLSA